MSEASLRTGVHAAIRGLWSGALDSFGFIDALGAALRLNLPLAWKQGAAVCGVKPEEYTPEEKAALNNLLNSQYYHLANFAQEIMAGDKAHGGKLAPWLARGETWVTTWRTAYNRAQAMACGNRKLKWVLGETEHCPSCLKLAGKVKRANYWEERRIWPQSPPNDKLECGGWRCQCALVPTNEPASRGPLPNLP